MILAVGHSARAKQAQALEIKLQEATAVTQVERRNTNGGDAPCKERRALSEALLAAIRTLMDLSTQQTEAIISNDADFSRFDDLIHVAQIAKNNAKYALLAHVQEHQCE